MAIDSQARDVVDECVGHGWDGVARGAKVAVDALTEAGALLASVESAADQMVGALESVPGEPSVSVVAHHLEQVMLRLDECFSSLKDAGQALHAAQQAVESAGIARLLAQVVTLVGQAGAAQMLATKIREDLRAERAMALGVFGPPSASPPPGRNIQGPAVRWPLKPPNSSRHLLDRITKNSRKKAENTVVLPGVDIGADIRDIQEGRARWNSGTGRYETPSGRIYGVKPGGTMFPDSGPGLVRLNRLEYEALQYYIDAGGDRRTADDRMANNPTLTGETRRRAYEVFKRHKSYRGQ